LKDHPTTGGRVTGGFQRPGETGDAVELRSFPQRGVAVVFGAGGGIGGALVDVIRATEWFDHVVASGRSTSPSIDLLDEASLERASVSAAAMGELRLVIDATGFLHDDRQEPEKSWRQLDAANLARSFAVNATGPALIMKHVLPRLPRSGKAVFATLSARVGSIGDNRLGGWYAYRASKAALNQLVRTAAVELARRSPDALCLALHPGTVATTLSAPFAASGLEVHSPQAAARHLLAVVDHLTAADTGGFFDWRGDTVPW
jgi:NAD(P)-dependent dehydrogenase (short-subunit alcohol dehydrogenase family)